MSLLRLLTLNQLRLVILEVKTESPEKTERMVETENLLMTSLFNMDLKELNPLGFNLLREKMERMVETVEMEEMVEMAQMELQLMLLNQLPLTLRAHLQETSSLELILILLFSLMKITAELTSNGNMIPKIIKSGIT